jgi:hypothetical protein
MNAAANGQVPSLTASRLLPAFESPGQHPAATHIATHCLKLGGKKSGSARPVADRNRQWSIHLRFRSPQGLADLR